MSRVLWLSSILSLHLPVGQKSLGAPRLWLYLFAENCVGTTCYPDHLNTPRVITRPSDNAVVWKNDNTEPFGNSAPNENPSGFGQFTYNLRFPGQYADVETGTNYNYFRDYDPTIGRYIESDPIGQRGGINTYLHVGGDPLTQIDPFGLANGPAIGWMRPQRPSPAGYFGIEGYYAPPGRLGVGGGLAFVTCSDKCGKKKYFRYYKICLSATSGAGVSSGPIFGMDGENCKEDTYAGYFGEVGSSLGPFPVTAGFDQGFDTAKIPGYKGPIPLPGRPSGTSEIGLGFGTPGVKAALCYYVAF